MTSLPRHLVLATSLLLLSSAASADTLLVQRVKHAPANMPTRGMSSAQVEAKYGAPAQKLEQRGGQKKAWPAINRWAYPTFTVYFEQGRVIDAVANQVGDNEIGPKPVSP